MLVQDGHPTWMHCERPAHRRFPDACYSKLLRDTSLPQNRVGSVPGQDLPVYRKTPLCDRTVRNFMDSSARADGPTACSALPNRIANSSTLYFQGPPYYSAPRARPTSPQDRYTKKHTRKCSQKSLMSSRPNGWRHAIDSSNKKKRRGDFLVVLSGASMIALPRMYR